MSIPTESSAALNRVADALFACAKEQKRQTRLQERAVAVSEAMFEVQKVNLAVTKALEARLTLEGAQNAGPVN